MGVVEVGGVLVIEDDAAVAVIAGVLGAAHLEGEHEVRCGHILDQGNVQRAAERRLVGALAAVDAEDAIPRHHAVCPARLVRDLPAVTPFFKILAEDQRPAIECGRCLRAGDGCGDEQQQGGESHFHDELRIQEVDANG